MRVPTDDTANWPRAVFLAWLDEWKEANNIPSDMQLAMRAGIPSPSVISGWRNGRARPSRESLRKIAALTGEPPIRIWALAGLADEEETGGPVEPPRDPLPPSIQNLVALYRRSNEDTRDELLREVDYLVRAFSRREN
jgi:transcriptional regulator with XRE-family HTH domain